MSFHFVNQSDINKRERKLIRSHVMKGKNLGRKIQKRGKRSEQRANESIIMASNHETALIRTWAGTQCDGPILALTRHFADDLGLLYPTNGITPQIRLRLQQLCFYTLDIMSPPDFCQSTGVIEWLWYQLALHNKAYFHCTIAMASAWAAFLTGDSYHSPVALGHMSEAYRLVNIQLSSKDALSDTTVAVVAAINIYDRLYGNAQKAMVHHNGLTNLIALRGGIRELAKKNFVIAEKAFRSDIELALHCGSRPKFSSKDVPRHLILINSKDCPEAYNPQEAELTTSILYLSVGPELRDAVLDSLRLSYVLDRASRKRKLDPTVFQTTLIYVGYRLLETKLLHHGFRVGTTFDILVQLAMIGFQNTFCFGIGRKLVIFPLLVEQFRSVARTISENNRPRQMVVFWALLIGKVSSLTLGEDSWLVPKLKTLANELGFRTWPEVSNALRAFPWVKAAHEAQGEEFWNTKLAQDLPL
ncbi:hypothetical protein GQX73_g5833 [Xylaria multiplex]|uniref:Uncharacterized protein n=1 Tax=Xylaria multiplex TaxID=323545 RepID=A0A7C8MTP0_9PEZI|nr:hypothetical protein GQX73_g5833 [Xylaria multiplex]